MAPDIKTLLAQKIRTEESAPVAWNKQVVWAKVSERVTTKRSNKTFFYVAAVFTLLLVAVRIHHPATTPVEMAEAIEAKAKEPFARTETIPDKVVEVEREKQEAVQIHPHVIIAEPEPIEALTRQPVEEAREVQMELNLEEPVLIVETFSKETIQPIVGVVEQPNNHNDEQKQTRKKRFHKLEASEKEWNGSSGNNSLLFARIK